MFKKDTCPVDCIYKWSIAGGILEIAYVVIVSLFMVYIGEFITNSSPVLGMLLALLLLVFSVGISGIFVFGVAVYLAFQKKFKEALLSVLITLLTIVIGIVGLVLIIFLIK